MGETGDRIILDYRRTIEQAERLDELAKQIELIADQTMENALKNISVGWRGEKSEQYIRKGRKLEQQIYRRAKSLREAAEVLRKTAWNTYRAEMLSVEIIKKRIYR